MTDETTNPIDNDEYEFTEEAHQRLTEELAEARAEIERITHTNPDANRSWSEMRESHEARVAELEEQVSTRDETIQTLAAAVRRGLVLESGFDPESTKGQRLVKDLDRGEIIPDDGETMIQAVTRFADSEYEWQPNQTARNANETEQAALAGAASLAGLKAVSVSDQPLSQADKAAALNDVLRRPLAPDQRQAAANELNRTNAQMLLEQMKDQRR